MAMPILKAGIRQLGTKHSIRELRSKGFVPGILYGKKAGSIPIYVSKKDLLGIKGAQLVEVKLPEVSYPAIIREIQNDPIGRGLRHVDLQQVDMGKKIRTEIPVHLTGTPAGVEQGGILHAGEKSVEVEAFPGELPDSLEADISALLIGDKFTVGDLKKTTGLDIVSDPSRIIASVASPRTEEKIETAEAVGTASEVRESIENGDGSDSGEQQA